MFHLELDQQTTYTLTALLPLLIQVGALAFAIWVDAYFKPKQKRVFLALLTLVLFLIAQNYLDVLFYRWKTGDLSRTLTGMLGYLLRPIILLLLYYLVAPEGRFWQGWTLVGINTALYLTPLFSRLVFYIDGNHYHGGPLSKTCLIVSLILLAGLVLLSLRKARQTRGREIWIPIVLVPIILLSIWLDYCVGNSEQPVTFLTIGIVGCCTLYYLWPHLQTAQLVAKEQREWQRTQLMLSQIKPHFLYSYAGRPDIGAVENPFTDVPDGKYYTQPVLWAVDRKITSGTSATTFSPKKECTRAQVVTFLYQYFIGE